MVLASNISKVFENVLFTRQECFLLTNANQFGCKSKHGTGVLLKGGLDWKMERKTKLENRT